MRSRRLKIAKESIDSMLFLFLPSVLLLLFQDLKKHPFLGNMQAIRRHQIARLRALVSIIEQRCDLITGTPCRPIPTGYTSDLDVCRGSFQDLRASSDWTSIEHIALCTHSLRHNAAALGQFRQYAKDSKQSEPLLFMFLKRSHQ